MILAIESRITFVADSLEHNSCAAALEEARKGALHAWLKRAYRTRGVRGHMDLL
jgi:hypothetical protein